MKKLLTIALALAVPSLAFGTISANTIWEVRGATGSDTNGGGFVAGASGTDWSQQGSPQYSVTNGVTNGSTTITSATASFGTDVVGNIIYVQGGTGSITAGWYEIKTRSSATTITVDRSTGLTSGTGVTLTIGGALATIGQMATNQVGGNTAYVKADGTYTISTGVTFAATNGVTQTFGYTTTRGDNGKTTVQAGAAITMFTVSGTGQQVMNFIIDGNGVGTNGVNMSGLALLQNCFVKNLTGYGVTAGGQSIAADIEVTGCGGTAGLYLSSGASATRIYSHGNSVPGISTASFVACVVTDSISSDNTGVSSDGILWGQSAGVIQNCVTHNNGRDGIRFVSSVRFVSVNNCILSANAGYGINNSSGGSSVLLYPQINNNAFYSNGSGATNGYAAGTSSVILTGTPFVNPTAGDFSLNNTPGAGASCRAAGLPGSIAATTGYRDIGIAQHADSGGAGGVSRARVVNKHD